MDQGEHLAKESESWVWIILTVLYYSHRDHTYHVWEKVRQILFMTEDILFTVFPGTATDLGYQICTTSFMLLQFRAPFKGWMETDYFVSTTISFSAHNSVFFKVFNSVDKVSNCVMISLNCLLLCKKA
jgi:hypothetical protein